MTLLVKFRSARKFYTVQINGGQPTISLRNLRSKLAGVIEDFPSNDDVNRAFDLIFYDAVSGEEFDEHNPNIRSGTTVFIKRVPCSHRTSMEDNGNNALEKFLTDFPPVPEWTPTPPPPQINNVPRVAEPIPKVRAVDFHPELRCQICQYYLRDATLILCCYETFCKNCIDNELRKGRCPKCLSGNNIAMRRRRRLIPNRLARSMVDRYVYSRNIPDEGSVTREELPKFTHDSKRKVHQSNEARASSKRKAMETNDSDSSTSEEAGTSGQDSQINCNYQENFYGWNHFTRGWSGAAIRYPMHYSAGYYWAAPMKSYYMLYRNPFYGYWWGVDPSNFASTSTTPFLYQTHWGHMYSNHNYFSSLSVLFLIIKMAQGVYANGSRAIPTMDATSRILYYLRRTYGLQEEREKAL